jgi:molybdate transport system substrate-binding protein
MTASRPRKSRWMNVALLGGALVGVLMAMYLLRSPESKPTIVVYCAAGIRLPVEQAAKEYEKEYGIHVRLDFGSSGELEGKLGLDRDAGKPRADLYIPADKSFGERTRKKDLSDESIELAQFSLVVAVKTESTYTWTSVDELLAAKTTFVLCDEKAGVGKKTHRTLAKSGHWDRINATKKSSFPRVTEAANAIKTSGEVEAGFIWDTTAKQFGLKILKIQELAGATSTITANVVRSSTQPAEALRFARYLAAPDRGQRSFKQFQFTPIGTDAWAEIPEVVFYCGGLNRDAVLPTIREFEKREGCKVVEQFAGCGTLVAGIRTLQSSRKSKGLPDAFMTCDAAYLAKVQELFHAPADVSSTQVVMLVRKGNPKTLLTIDDLAKPGLKIGTTDRRASTLGELSWKLFEESGVAIDIKKNKSMVATSGTAHELLLKMQANGKLDVVLVYRANCQHLSDDYEQIGIQHERAKAVQNMAVLKKTPYPALAARLMNAMRSDTSRQRFENFGFDWHSQGTER